MICLEDDGRRRFQDPAGGRCLWKRRRDRLGGEDDGRKGGRLEEASYGRPAGWAVFFWHVWF
jgi:hypothetical protein